MRLEHFFVCCEWEPTQELYSPDFKCQQCDYTNITVKGMGQHVRMKHRVSQVDGIIDSDEESIEETSPVDIIDVQLPFPLCKEGGLF